MFFQQDSKNLKPYQLSPMVNVQNGSYKSVLYAGLAPGKYNKSTNTQRSLDDDLKVIANSNVKVIICLMQWSELEKLKIINYPRKAQEYGFIFYHLPIIDGSYPNDSDVNSVINIAKCHLSKGQSVLIHCREGKNRTGLICGCCLVKFGYNRYEVIEKIQNCRPGSLQSINQQKYITSFKNY